MKYLIFLILKKCCSTVKYVFNNIGVKQSCISHFSSKSDSFLHGNNSIYVEQMYDAWLQDPKRFTYEFIKLYICLVSKYLIKHSRVFL